MDDREKQIPPPSSWELFEDLCHQLFMAIWCDPLAQKVGRRGQAQHGVDVFGSPNGDYESVHGVQCRLKEDSHGSKLCLTEIQREIAKAEGFEPALQHWVFATTSPVDAILQTEARKISVIRQSESQFTVSVLGWGAIKNLLCHHKQVLSQFYPEFGFDVSELLESMRSMPHASEVRDLLTTVRTMGNIHGSANLSIPSTWRPVVFRDGRDMGPALLGRSLGPEDAAACPRLQETDIAINQLKQAYSVRIAGEPGTGKSISAYQVALQFANDGWTVLRLNDPRVETIELDIPEDPKRVLFIIDDAHLTSESALRIAEDTAGPYRLLLSTHNTVQGQLSSRGAITIDSSCAVRTIASALRAEPVRTLALVQRIDNHVGPLPSNTTLEDRINQAEKYAMYPWQFCFILGGGWRRATGDATAARLARADITLAAIAMHQLASRDARPTPLEITSLAKVAGITEAEFQAAVQWLIHNRHIIGPHDMRCPHQRFALVVLTRILEGQDKSDREKIGRLFKYVVSNTIYPISGLRLLLFELRFSGETRPWTTLVPTESFDSLIERCWQASDPDERMFASLLLAEIGGYVKDWPQTQFKGREATIGRWISDPVEPSGYGLARLIHAVRNKDKVLARVLVEESQPETLAGVISSVTPITAYSMGELLTACLADKTTPWGRSLRDSLDRRKLVDFAGQWPQTEPAWAFGKYCGAMIWWDETLALDMFERFIPTAQEFLENDPISAFRDLRDIGADVLRILDVLGIYVGQLAPKPRQRALARKLLDSVTPIPLAERLSTGQLREFQSIGFLLHFMARATPAKFRLIVAAMDWVSIAETIGDQWRNLPHDAEVLFGIAYGAEGCRETIARVIHDNLWRVEAFPPRLSLIAPKAAYQHAESGGLIRLAHHNHIDWRFGISTIAYFAEERPELLETMLGPSEIPTGRVLSNSHPSWYREAANYVQLLREVAPLSLQRILDAVDVEPAEKGWVRALRKGKGPRKTVAHLIDASLERTDALGILAKRLRIRFPKSSVPHRL